MNSHLLHSVATEFPVDLWSPFKTLIAVSGGPDSVALLQAMTQLSDDHRNLAVLHVDHGLRGERSQSEANFVQQLTNNCGLDFHLVRLDTVQTEKAIKKSEESFRNLRYDAFVKTAHSIGARYLVTGHHLDDQVETVLFRILRGTGISGLRGIPKYRVVDDALTIVRPLLKVSRNEIERFLNDINQTFCLDESNQRSDYTRNFLRNEILPTLEDRFPDVQGAISRLAVQADELDSLLLNETKKLNDCIVQQSAEIVRLDGRTLLGCPAPVLQRFLAEVWRSQDWPMQSMDSSWWKRLTNAVQACEREKTTFNLPGNVLARFENGQIELECLKRN